jgi:hypothetical protein
MTLPGVIPSGKENPKPDFYRYPYKILLPVSFIRLQYTPRLRFTSYTVTNGDWKPKNGILLHAHNYQIN